jgi:hypothetical protein
MIPDALPPSANPWGTSESHQWIIFVNCWFAILKTIELSAIASFLGKKIWLS